MRTKLLFPVLLVLAVSFPAFAAVTDVTRPATSGERREFKNNSDALRGRYIEIYFVGDSIHDLTITSAASIKGDRIRIVTFTESDAIQELQRLREKDGIGLADLRRPGPQKRRLRVWDIEGQLSDTALRDGSDAEPASLGQPNFDKGNFMRTDRNFASLAKHLWPLGDPRSWRGPLLDMGCGGGSFVRELRAFGVDAHGLDLVLSRDQVAEPDFFVAADMAFTPYPDESFEIITNLWSVFRYAYYNHVPNREEEAMLSRALHETRRILKVGGVSLIAPLNRSEGLIALIGRVPGLRVKQVFTPEKSSWTGLLVERIY